MSFLTDSHLQQEAERENTRQLNSFSWDLASETSPKYYLYKNSRVSIQPARKVKQVIAWRERRDRGTEGQTSQMKTEFRADGYDAVVQMRPQTPERPPGETDRQTGPTCGGRGGGGGGACGR